MVRRQSFFLHVIKGFDCVRNTALQSVIRVNQQRARIRIKVCVRLECLELRVKTHDPAVCVGSHDRHAKELAAENVAGSDATADDGCSRAVGSGIRPLRTAESELHDTASARRMADPCGLGRNQALMVHNVEDRRLNKLSLHDRSDDLDQRLTRENQRAFRDRVNIAGKLEISKIIQKCRCKLIKTSQVLDVLTGEMKLLYVLHELLDAAHDGVSSSARIVAEKRIKNDRTVLFLVLKIPLHHREFIKIREQRKILPVHIFLSWLQCSPASFHDFVHQPKNTK